MNPLLRVFAQELEPQSTEDGDTEDNNRWDAGEIPINASARNGQPMDGAEHGETGSSAKSENANQQADMETDEELSEVRGSGDTSTAASAETAAATGAVSIWVEGVGSGLPSRTVEA